MAEPITKEYVRKMLSTDDGWATRAIVVLYERQTDDEKVTGATKHENSMGFNGVDSQFLSDLARQILDGRRLSAKQLIWAKKKLPKYAGQILSLIQAKKS